MGGFYNTPETAQEPFLPPFMIYRCIYKATAQKRVKKALRRRRRRLRSYQTPAAAIKYRCERVGGLYGRFYGSMV